MNPSSDQQHAQVDFPNRDLLEAATEFTNAFQRWMSTISSDGLTYPRLRVLEELHCRGPAKLKSLADLVGMSARNITVLADGLESEGLAKRVGHPSDRRVTLLELTPQGLAEADEALSPRLSQMGKLFEQLSPRQRSDLLKTLRQLVATIDELDPGCG